MGYYSDEIDDHVDPREWDDGPEDPDFHKNVRLLRETEKAYLFEIPKKGDCWIPKSVVMVFDETTIGVPTWFELKGLRQV